MIRLRGVSKRFDETLAVDHLDLEVLQNKLFGLIGPNGAGKTTTLKMLATLIKPDEGGIDVDGLDLHRDVQEIRRRVGYMPDSFGTFRGLTCTEYLQFFGYCHGIRGQDLHRRVADVLALTDLGGRRDELTSALSMGLRQRLLLAKTLVHDPDILLLDEPASGLDPRARIEIRVFLRELASMGKTIIISSHILADLEDICTDVAIIEHGRSVWCGPLASVTEAEFEAGQTIELRVPEADTERATAVLGRVADVTDLVLNGRQIELRLHSDDTNSVLHALMAAGLQVLHFSRKATGLEDLFLTQTKGVGT